MASSNHAALLAEVKAAQDPAKALSPLLALWERTRDPEVAACIERLGAKVRKEVVAAKGKAAFARWCELAAAKDPVVLESLLPTLFEVADTQMRVGDLFRCPAWVQLEALASWPADPRIARRLIELLSSLPRRSTEAWRRLFEVLETHWDPRQAPALATLRSGFAGRIKTARFARALEEGADQLLRKKADWLPEEPLTEAQRRQLPAGPAPEKGMDQLEEALLRAIATNPADDSCRLVYADWLEEHGRLPHAEFVRAAVQATPAAEPGKKPTRQKAAPTEKKRKAKVDLSLRTQTLGALAPFVLADTVRFDRGVPTELGFELAELQVAEVAACPALTTVTRLALAAGGRWYAPLFASKHLGALRRLELGRGVEAPLVEALLHSPLNEQLTELSVSLGSLERAPQFEPALAKALASEALLPKLTSLTIDARRLEPTQVLEVLQWPVCRRSAVTLCEVGLDHLRTALSWPSLQPGTTLAGGDRPVWTAKITAEGGVAVEAEAEWAQYFARLARALQDVTRPKPLPVHLTVRRERRYATEQNWAGQAKAKTGQEASDVLRQIIPKDRVVLERVLGDCCGRGDSTNAKLMINSGPLRADELCLLNAMADRLPKYQAVELYCDERNPAKADQWAEMAGCALLKGVPALAHVHLWMQSPQQVGVMYRAALASLGAHWTSPLTLHLEIRPKGDAVRFLTLELVKDRDLSISVVRPADGPHAVRAIEYVIEALKALPKDRFDRVSVESKAKDDAPALSKLRAAAARFGSPKAA